jgi:GT2 family glycosyltransferase/glycosyltransferase involved in cell wall biosynthesis
MDSVDEDLTKELRVLFEQDWYLSRYPDVQVSGMDPLTHYIRFGANERRDPNRFFDGVWYRAHYADVAASGIDPLVHYLRVGAPELRNPHPRFDTAWYAEQHVEAAGNPLLFHLLFGRARGWPTERPIRIADFLSSKSAPPTCPSGVVVDVVIPVYRGFAETKRCLDTVLADPDRPAGRIIVVDDCSPEPDLSAWLRELKSTGRILMLRNQRNRGFVASANAGIEAAGEHDVVLLNSDTEVPPGWLARLAGHTYSAPRIASVSPFSNNATICGYPSIAGGPPAFDLPVASLDEACRTANGARHVQVPTTVGFCMYIRRAALRDVGLFDAATFGRGYGEENDFCLRASARGWHHLLACDTFVFHAGKVSFGADGDRQSAQGQTLLARRWPHYARLIDQHIRQDEAGPARLAATAALFRHLGRPVILLVTHGLGGGVRRHISDLIRRSGDRANFLLLESTTRGIALSVPALPGHSVAVLPAEQIDGIAAILRSAGVSCVHIHHLLGMDLDLRHLIHALDVPFDVTVHDYYTICPQVNLLPWLDAQYCNEPAPAVCNACIADRPSHDARDITSWRLQHSWLFHGADRVLCPSRDVHDRLARFGLAARAIVVPHDPVAASRWPLSPPRLTRGGKLRIALIGVLAQQKGAPTVAAVLEAADPEEVDVRLIGYPEHELPATIRRRVRSTGEYEDDQLPGLLAKINPHVVWFPAQWPETYSYTLTAAIEAGLPIVASRIGAFPERLEGRPLTWLIDPASPPSEWLEAFAAVRRELSARVPISAVQRSASPDFYTEGYIQPATRHRRNAGDTPRPRRSIVLIPERFSTGAPTPCAYIRLIQPFDHLAATAGFDLIVSDAADALHYRPDLIVTQRHAVAGEAGQMLLRHCRQHRIPLLYDLDDDLLGLPRMHPDARRLRPLVRDVERMLRGASAVWVSTPELLKRIRRLRNGVQLVPNGLDERLWADPPATRLGRQAPIRILFMGTLTHDADFALVEPALSRLHAEFPGRVGFDMIGVSGRQDLPTWVNRLPLAISANLSYPGFVNWLVHQPGWDIGIAPLAGSSFNAAKSAIKAMDYAALGLAVLASDVPAYRGALSPDSLVPNTETAWFEALSRLVRDPARRHRMAADARARFAEHWTLAAQTELRGAALEAAIAPKSAPRGSAAPPARAVVPVTPSPVPATAHAETPA